MDDEPQAGQQDRRRAVTEALAEVLEDDEVFVVARVEGKLVAVVPESPASGKTPGLSLREPELYGRLMKLEARLCSPPGAWLGSVLIVGSLLLCLALVTGADLPLLSESVTDGLRSGWAYAGIVALGVLAHFLLKGILRRLTWLGGKSDLARALRSASLTTDELLAELRGDEALGTLKTFVGRSAGNDKE